MPTNTLQDWFATPLGQYLLEKEQAYLDDVTPDIFGFHALQLGLPEVDLLRASRIAHRMRVASDDHPDVCREVPRAADRDPVDRPGGAAARARVRDRAARDPARGRPRDDARGPPRDRRASIRGASGACAAPSGSSRSEYPWNGSFVSLLRVKDWLALLGFDVSAGRLGGLRAALRQRDAAPPLRLHGARGRPLVGRRRRRLHAAGHQARARHAPAHAGVAGTEGRPREGARSRQAPGRSRTSRSSSNEPITHTRRSSTSTPTARARAIPARAAGARCCATTATERELFGGEARHDEQPHGAHGGDRGARAR